jgi:CBS domain-containing protein
METILVADIMTRNPLTVPSNTSLLKCAKIMVKKKTGSLLLVEGKKLVGIISRKDILWALVKKSKKDLSEIMAIDISPRKIATIKPTRTLDYAIKKIKKVKFARLPVIHHGELVGLITAKDIFNYNPNLFPEMRDYNQIREWDKKMKRIQKARQRRFSEGEGICEECGNIDFLYHFNGLLVCDSCRNS